MQWKELYRLLSVSYVYNNDNSILFLKSLNSIPRVVLKSFGSMLRAVLS